MESQDERNEQAELVRRLRDRDQIREEMVGRGVHPVTLEPLSQAEQEAVTEEIRGF